MAGYFLLKELAPGIDPLSPENFGIPMIALPLAARLRLHVITTAARSPLTGGYSGQKPELLGPELRNAG
jgi:aldehyde:ferredoxin oxidoreductase